MWPRYAADLEHVLSQGVAQLQTQRTGKLAVFYQRW